MKFKRVVFVFGMTLTSLVQPAAAQSRGATPDPERTAVQQVISDLAARIQSGDFAAIDSMFRGRGVHILTDTATTHGWPEYRDKFLKPELARYKNLQFTHGAIEPQVRGLVAWVAFREELSGETSSGPTKVSGRGTAVLEKIDDKWRIVHLHVSR